MAGFLVITRRVNEGATIFDEAGRKVGEIKNFGPEKVKFGISLPPELKIVRNELLDADPPADGERTEAA